MREEKAVVLVVEEGHVVAAQEEACFDLRCTCFHGLMKFCGRINVEILMNMGDV